MSLSALIAATVSMAYSDVHLLASVALAGSARLWTRDKRLAALAADLKLAYAE